MVDAVLFSSRSEEWGTPQKLFDSLNAEFKFDLDPCASVANRKCERFFDKEKDGLAQDWGNSRIFMNPPYGKNIGLWMQKAYESSLSGALVVCLVHTRTDTRWWHSWVEGKAAEIRLLRGRLKFEGGLYSSTFPSVLIIYRPDFKGATGIGWAHQ